MNSERFMLQNSLEANYLNISLNSGDGLDEIAVKVIQKDCPDFLIPFRLLSVNEEIGLKYKLINTVALEYADMTLPKALFVQMYLNLLEPFIKGKDWFLDYHNLCVDARYVYLDKHTYNVFFIYVPAWSFRSTDQDIIEFFKNVFMNIMINDDKDFQMRLFRFFGGNHITLAGLYQLMMEEKGLVSSRPQPGISQPVPPQLVSPQPVSQQPSFQQRISSQPVLQQTGFPQSEVDKKEGIDSRKREKKNAPIKNQVSPPQTGLGYGEDSSEDEVVQALFGDNKKRKKEKPSAENKKAEKDAARKKKEEKGHGGFGGLFGGKKQQGNNSIQKQSVDYAAESNRQAPSGNNRQQIAAVDYALGAADYGAMYGGNDFPSDETEVFSDGTAAAGIPWLELIDFSQPGALQKIDLNFTGNYITIGRMSSDEKRPDVAFPGEFKRIGRQHARIERKGNDLFVIDLGSANHTMLDRQVLVPNQPYLLQDGMELAFTVSKPVRYRVHI